ncbi:DUF654-domain-containing protein [Glonium stellatum]|uniref:DUF654-domain-containing protein n=1 Tax=Glonium stellatum TaxID=574774 RepID=A0A8E2JSY6_9PEZI|nr:DUF654-domain-containing protein [Glonium stellatum]
MSSRALRRAQRELEERQQLEKLSHQEADESDDEPIAASSNKVSAFALLGADDEEGDDGEQDVIESDKADSDEEQMAESARLQPQTSKASKRKKKKKGKGRKDPEPKLKQKTPSSSSSMPQFDEIDRALRSLSLNTSQSKPGGASNQLTKPLSKEIQQLFSVLSIDTQHLHASNEMRRLFGRAALEGSGEAEATGGRRRGRGPQQVGIAGAVAGRNAPGGRNLASLGLRRNIFIQGKEEWPRATSGGLGMEIVEKKKDGTVEYRFVHNGTYQDVQRQFESCVASMDPNRMVQLLQYNPYHISTLLQVSEIAKQERDHATSGDLLERALFSLGRSVHSSFSQNLSQGKARLDFRRPENREFWLAAWRYISNLGMRATWRTAFEWAKLVLSLDPDEDPYCVRLVIDQLAMRGRQPQQFIDLAESDYLRKRWGIPPNIAMTLGLAYSQLNQPEKARSKLSLAIQEYPWVAAGLCQELDINPIPQPIWGRQPLGDYQTLLCELYVTKAKDIWNTPEATSLLVEVASSCTSVISVGSTTSWLLKFDKIKVARHVILTDDRALISLLDHRITAQYTSTSDPLPPKDNLPSYTTEHPGNQARRNLSNPDEILREYATLQSFFRGLIPWLFEGEGAINPETGAPPTEEDFERRIAESGVSPNTIAERTARLQELRHAVQELEVGFEDDEEQLGDFYGDGTDSHDSHE